MDLVMGAMGNLAPKLLQLLQSEYNLQKGVRKEIQFLSEELESIHGALRKVAATPPDQLDEQVRIWARQVREASYDVENILDTFLVRVEGCPEPTDQGMLKRIVKRMGELFIKAKACRNIANAIEDIKKRLQEVSERRDRFKVNETVAKLAASSTVDPRLEAMYKEVTQLVGIDGAMSELISMLYRHRDHESNGKLKIISILGIGGSGKTTLAKAVYDKLKSQFVCWAFVPVGRNPDLKKVFRDILIDLDKHKYMVEVNLSILDEKQLIDELRNFLECNRCFIVIDDVWETNSWETIRLALVDNNDHGSKIISTTRKSEVTSGEVYRIQPLSVENSKRLFHTRIFGEGKCADNEVNEASDKILKKCGGIPLSIITMASLLVGKPRGEWYDVCNSTCFYDKFSQQVDKTMEILSLSYYDLPCHLRTCLLYLSAFPADYTIDKNSLIWMWIAEDFVHKKQGFGLFEVGEGYFNDLVNRSMIQAVESEYNGVIHGCRVHGMVLDLLCFLSHEENFVRMLDNDEGLLSISSAHRLAHKKSTMDAHMNNNMGMQKVRSFFAYSCEVVKELLFLSFKLLRVLDLENIYSKRWNNAEHIGYLHHLRFLGLKRTDMPELPKEIGALKFLQTLDLARNLYIKELPLSVGQLTQLVCLRALGTSVPNGVIKRLTSLQELLVQCDVNEHENYKGQFIELGNLSELRALTIKVIKMNQSMLSDLLHSVGNLHKIQSLRLDRHYSFSGGIYKATFDSAALPQNLQQLLMPVHQLSRFPSCINPTCLINLSHLELRVTAMDEQSMQIIGRLPDLRHLGLSTESTVTVSNIATESCFQRLRSCKFFSSMVLFVLNENASVSFTLWNGKDDIVFGSKNKNECTRAQAVMPNLQELLFKVQRSQSIRKCKGIYGDLGLEYLTSLEKVTVTIDRWWYSLLGEMTEAESGLRHAIDVHPNHPTLIFGRIHEDILGRDVPDCQGSTRPQGLHSGP